MRLLNDIEELLYKHNLEKNEHLIRTIKALIEITEDGNPEKNLKLIKESVLELQQSFHVFNQYKHRRKVCIFGSARTPKEDENYQMAKKIAGKLNALGYMIVTGAGPGIMQAGNEGAKEGESFGLNIELPFEQEANPAIQNSDKLINFKYFFTRKLIFIKETDATVIFPGGFGTMDEAFELLTLIQTGRCSPRPLIFMTHKESKYWERWLQYIEKEMVGKKYISTEDLHFLTVSHSTEEAVNCIHSFYSIYHSIRYENNIAYIRLHKKLSEKTIIKLKETFKNLFKEESLMQVSPEEIPYEKKHYPEKIILKFEFKKKEFGDICGLIKYFTKLEEELK